jgi:PKD repeat protein
VQSNARWKLTTETSWHSSGEKIVNIRVGSSCTIQFKDVSGWTKPSEKTVTINEGTNSESGRYTKKTGTLTVTIYPSEVQSNARWKLTTETGWHSSGEKIVNIQVGSSCTIQFKDVSDWTKPSEKTVTINEGTNSESGRYTLKSGSLKVTIYPSEVRSNARWKLTSDTTWHSSGDTISNIPIGSTKVIRFNDVSGWTKPYDMTITIKKGSNYKHNTYKERAVNYMNLAQAARIRAATIKSIWAYYVAQGDEDKLNEEVDKAINKALQEGFETFIDAISQHPTSGHYYLDGCIALGGLLAVGHEALVDKIIDKNDITKMVNAIDEMGDSTVDAVKTQQASQALTNAEIIGRYPNGECDLKEFINALNREATAWENFNNNNYEDVKRALRDEAFWLGFMEGKMMSDKGCVEIYYKLNILKELTDSPSKRTDKKYNEMRQIEDMYIICGGDWEEIVDEWRFGTGRGWAEAKCPVNLHAYDSIGRHVGANESGGVDLEIPGAYYSGIDSRPQKIQIFGTNDYYFVVEALDQGEFNLTTESHTYEETTTVQYEHVAIENDTKAIIDPSKEGYSMNVDEEGDNNIDYAVDPTSVETNHPPEVSIIAIVDDVIFKGDISISYTLKDIDNDICNISARYSTDQMIWHDATMGSGGDGTIGLTTSAEGVSHTYVWASGVDLPDISAVVYFEIRPKDGMLDGIYGISNAFYVGEVTAAFTHSPSNPTVKGNIVFGAYASIGNITNYAWDFDDGNNISTNEPVLMHAYTSAGDYNVILTVTDNYGASNTINKKIRVYPFANDSYLISLYTSWNLISLPLIPDDTNVRDIMNTVDGNWNSVWSYGTGNWKRYDLPGPDFLNDLTTIEPGKGYWIDIKFGDTLSVSGSEPTDKSIPLSAGWNLVGYKSLNSTSTTEAMNSVDGNWNSVWSYETGNWKRYDLNGPSFLNDLTTMEPGKGYWIDMKSSDTWTLGA